MDLIYTDKKRQDVGVLKDYTFDLAFGSDENDFELTVDVSNHCCEPGCLVYIENTEYGGIVDGLGVVTTDDKLTYMGRTWHGIVASKVIEPDADQTHLKVSGEANQVIGELLVRCGLSELFAASTESSGLVIDAYSFDRYVDAYLGIKKMLASVNGKLKFSFINGRVILSALPAVDYSQDEQFDNDQVEMQIEKTSNTVNHLICLGKGELEKRLVVHLYCDESGNISTTQTFKGIQEITAVYEDNSEETESELVQKGTEKFREYINADKVQLDFSAEEKLYDVGDLVGAKEIITETTVISEITKKIVTIRQGEVNIQYKVGE